MHTSNFEKVKDFMKAFGQTERASLLNPEPITARLADLRRRLITEEYIETIHGFNRWSSLIGREHTPDEAHAAAVEIVDGLTDLLYVIYGAFDTFGVDADVAFARVHDANMSKLGEDGNPIYREDGKVMKGPNFKPPELGGLISRT